MELVKISSVYFFVYSVLVGGGERTHSRGEGASKAGLWWRGRRASTLARSSWGFDECRGKISHLKKEDQNLAI